MTLLVTQEVLFALNYDTGEHPHHLCHKRAYVLNYIDTDDGRPHL